ncbi:N-formylglutamate deformylase [mine drainage metagenome]|uniref:N-formylglutamate deformylase n=2 Tax=mine drainage metagenome TaxID=410659 RepID=T1A537_9ZZZZ
MMMHPPAKPWILRPAEAPVKPVLVSIPHAGTWVSEGVRARFASEAIGSLPMTDWYLDQLYDFLPSWGVTSLIATYSRFVADCNRPPDGEALYPGRFETGFVPTETFDGEPIWSTVPDPAWIAAQKQAVWQPYHDRLDLLIHEWRLRFGRVCLIDAHSVSSAPNRITPRLEADIYLGDRDGRSANPAIRQLFESAFMAEGFRVSVNHPYKGGYITHHYGCPPGVMAVQIEMAERVYLDEDRPHVRDGRRWQEAQDRLIRVFAHLLSELG